VLKTLAEMIRSAGEAVSIDKVMADVGALLDRSVASEAYHMPAPRMEYGAPEKIDLSQIDFDLLREKFSGNHKRTKVEQLKAAIGKKLEEMVRLNRERMDYLEKFQEMIAEYNSGSKNVERFFDELLAFTKKLSEEEKRSVAEGLSEEELAVYDILMRPHPEMTPAEENRVKSVARELLVKLKAEKLVLDWRRRQQTRADVLVTVQEMLDELPRAYTTDLYQEKCQRVYQHVFDAYAEAGESVYTAA